MQRGVEGSIITLCEIDPESNLVQENREMWNKERKYNYILKHKQFGKPHRSSFEFHKQTETWVDQTSVIPR